jgi:hypothetical protein
VPAELRFRAWVEFVAIAQQLPIAAARVEASYRELAGLVGDDVGRAAEVQVFLARFLLYRGRLDEARRAAAAALAGKRAAAAGQVYDFHFYGLCGIALAAGDRGQARSTLQQWASAPDEMPPNRRLRRARAHAELALAEGDLETARAAVDHAVTESRLTDYEEVTGPVQWTRLRIAWARDDGAEVAAALRALGEYRQSERRMLRASVLAAFALERHRRSRPPGVRRELRRRREAAELAALLGNPAWDDAAAPPLLWI